MLAMPFEGAEWKIGNRCRGDSLAKGARRELGVANGTCHAGYSSHSLYLKPDSAAGFGCFDHGFACCDGVCPFTESGAELLGHPTGDPVGEVLEHGAGWIFRLGGQFDD